MGDDGGNGICLAAGFIAGLVVMAIIWWAVTNFRIIPV